jgi:GT2 family glycosyltransferase
VLIISYPVYILDWRNRRLLEKSLKSIRTSQSVQILLVVNGSRYPDFLNRLRESYGALIIENSVNSVSSAWRLAIDFAIRRGAEDVLLLANQDTQFGADTLDLLYGACATSEFVYGTPKNPIYRYSLWGGRASAFMHFAGRDIDRKNSGLPDLQFTPAYYEDNDFDRRLFLAGMRQTVVNAPYKHIGSAVIRFNRQARRANKKSFAENRRRYIAKWGGLPGRETFHLPYGDGSDLLSIDQ